MPSWAPGVAAVEIATPDKKRGVGAIRRVIFDDGRSIEEHITSWDAKGGFTYVATEGLPLRAYVATLAIAESGSGGTIRITWQSYMNSVKMTGPEFDLFFEGMTEFYEKSLARLKDMLHDDSA